ncbi:hypothetical protein I302_100077 [Kwoniella bestiolae CBS 10118]|uniref:Uncharacterized protein n=1 Tax=Kwoniella bestiolae CBS 10118 TaxID=1296100 RepID=A0A1B9G432_9TREE|nr:hypothetical protein I302_03449 [Kwoniella bestiolae CBS 10118]OCF25776.1 hypothetical protein I302_03449 [Kwoniella bestiolae CBS 10118]
MDSSTFAARRHSLVDDPIAFQRLLPVHELILHHLSQIKPTTYLTLSRYHFHKLIPSLYTTITPNLSSLHGLTLPTPANEHTLTALSHTTTLVLSPDSSSALYKATKGYHPFSKGYRELFKNVRSIVLSCELIRDRIRPISRRMDDLPAENNLWFHVKTPVENLTFEIESLEAKSKLEYVWKSAKLHTETSKMIASLRPESVTWRFHVSTNEGLELWGITSPPRTWLSHIGKIKWMRTVLVPRAHAAEVNIDSERFRSIVDRIISSIEEFIENEIKWSDTDIGNAEDEEEEQPITSRLDSRKDPPEWELMVEDGHGRIVESRQLTRIDSGRWEFEG